MVLAAVITTIVFSAQSRSSSPIDGLLVRLQSEVQAERWGAATSTAVDLQSEWQKHKTWLPLNASRNSIQQFDRLMARLRANVEVQDKPSAAATAGELHQIWKDFAG